VNEDNGPAKEESPKLDDSPAGLQRRWLLRLNAAKEFFEDFQNEGDKVVDEFLGKGTKGSRLNLFFGNVETKSATLSGAPKVRCRRRFADAKDATARVSAMALDRILNSDIERESDGYRTALANAKGDWLRPGLGQVWLRYVVETEETETPDPDTGEVVKGERKVHEDVETDHAKWRRFLWDPSETWDDVRAIYRALDLTKAEWEKRFPGRAFRVSGKGDKGKKDEIREAFGRAEVWEIWDKESRRVLHLSEQEKTILKAEPDPYGLPGFFPCPKPLMANVTTSKCIPRSTYYLAQPQYDEAHELQRRIRNLVKQVKVAGAYDSSNEGLQRILDDATDGKLIPVKNWASLVEKGGLQGAIAFLPMKETVEAIIALSERLALVKQEIYEITAQSDLTRGQSDPDKTATAARGEMRVFGKRVQSEQDEFARFASEAQRIRAALIAKFFDAETIAQRANIQPESEDAQHLPAAIELLKSSIKDYRIDVDSDSLAMTDYDAVRQERVEALTALGGYFEQAVPFVQFAGMAGPGVGVAAARLVVSNARWLLAGVKGAEALESDFERFQAEIEQAAKQPPPPPPPDPAVEREKIKTAALQQKAQIDQQKAHMDMQGKVMDLQLKKEELGLKREGMAMDLKAKQMDHVMSAQQRQDEHAMATEERHEEHAMHAEKMQMGMEAEKQRAKLKAKPKGNEK
jgi:hypothetical protein